jgi:hypothetical protein
MIKPVYKVRRFLGGFLAKTKVEHSQWLKFVKALEPVEAGWELIRIGSLGDGGYLVPNDLSEITGCISPGVSEMMDFELQLSAEFKIPSVLYDGSIDSPPHQDLRISFHKLFIGDSGLENYVSLPKSLDEFPMASDSSLILQMDIEGDELTSLASLERVDLNKFRILIVEFHRLQDWTNKTVFNQLVSPIFTKLKESFDIVHIHPNNCDGVFYFAGKFLPRAVEITFHNKSRRKKNPSTALIPHPLDCPNSKEAPDIKLSF